MDHARKKLLLCFLMLTLSACSSKKPEERLISILEEKYANLYVNDESHKRAVISDLKEFLKNNKLVDANLGQINRRLNQINDGHVVMFDDRPENNQYFTSGLKFVIGSNLVESCLDCKPAFEKGKYEIQEINNRPYAEFINDNKDKVAASSEWGRSYRISRLLTAKGDAKETTLKLKNFNGKTVTTTLVWQKEIQKPLACVTAERLAADIFKVHVSNLWCDETRGASWSREQIYTNFKNQFDTVMSSATDSDRIILELRENGGGGDEEVEYVLNAFNEKSVFMYHYKYLRKTHPGKRKWLEKFWPFKLSLWSPDEFQYTNIEHRPKKTFFKNKMSTMISAGCFSSCETIVSVLKNEKRSEVIGSKTHGGSGDPVIFTIKNTPFSINIPTCVNWQLPDVPYEGIGVQPNITLEQNPKYLEDNILKAAIDLTR